MNTYTLTGTAQGGSMLMPIIMIGVMVLMFVWMSRSQKKKDRADAEMRNNLAIGDEIITIGGIMGKVVNKREDTVVIETSSDRTKIKFHVTAIRSVEKKVSEPTESKPATFKVKK